MSLMSLAGREAQIKMTMRHQYTLSKVAKIHKTGGTKFWQEHEATGALLDC